MVIYDARPSQFNQLSTTAEWEAFQSAQVGSFNNGIDALIGSAMAPSLDTGGRNIVIQPGNAVIKGQLWRTDAAVSTPIPAPSAQNRIDRLALRYNRGATTSATVIQPIVITGTPSASPVPPSYTQTPTGIWDLPVCGWTAASNGALSGLFDERKLANDRWHDMRSEFGGLINSFTFTAGSEMPPQFRIRDDGSMVDVIGTVWTPGGSGAYNNTTFFQLPSVYTGGYSPGAGISWSVSLVDSWTLANQNYIGTPRTFLASGGGIQLAGIPYGYNGLRIRIYGSYPIGSTQGLKTSL